MLTFNVVPVVTAGKTVMQGPPVYGSMEIILTAGKVLRLHSVDINFHLFMKLNTDKSVVGTDCVPYFSATHIRFFFC
jgi:lipopolysaccharide/colanic/teichoic acid biosynthesis glycosyltransferase